METSRTPTEIHNHLQNLYSTLESSDVLPLLNHLSKTMDSHQLQMAQNIVLRVLAIKNAEHDLHLFQTDFAAFLAQNQAIATSVIDHLIASSEHLPEQRARFEALKRTVLMRHT